jgi:hypothetical protein
MIAREPEKPIGSPFARYRKCGTGIMQESRTGLVAKIG